MRILLTGSKGQLGSCIKAYLPENWEIIATDSTTLNITDAAAVSTMVQNFQPDVVINTAAYTAVDQAESEQVQAFAVNGSAVHHLASVAHIFKIRFIHISTDYVFNGHGTIPYTEVSPPEPLNVYGKSKLAGEILALAANPNSIILRTAWLFSAYGKNFVKTLLNSATQQNQISITGNQIGSPTYAGDLVQTIIHILNHPAAMRGIYHFGGSEPISRYNFAEYIIQTAAEHIPHFKTPVLHADTADYPTATAVRPSYSVLDSTKICTELSIPPSNWQKALIDTVKQLAT